MPVSREENGTIVCGKRYICIISADPYADHAPVEEIVVWEYGDLKTRRSTVASFPITDKNKNRSIMDAALILCHDEIVHSILTMGGDSRQDRQFRQYASGHH